MANRWSRFVLLGGALTLVSASLAHATPVPTTPGSTEGQAAKSTTPVDAAKASAAAKKFQIWAEAEPEDGPAPLAVEFNCDPLGTTIKAEELRFSWDFGDDSDRQQGQKVNHTFAKEGHYTVRCAATNAAGVRAEDIVQIDVDEPEEP